MQVFPMRNSAWAASRTSSNSSSTTTGGGDDRLAREQIAHEQHVLADDFERLRRARLRPRRSVQRALLPTFTADEKDVRYAESLKRSRDGEGLHRRRALVESITAAPPPPPTMTRDEFMQRYYGRTL